jgi:hypothetical protein
MQQEALTVEIKPEDFRDAPTGYTRPKCPLENAIQRMYPNSFVYVGHDRAVIGDLPNQIKYGISLKQWGRESTEWSIGIINDLSRRAKESLEGIPTVSLTLEPFIY